VLNQSQAKYTLSVLVHEENEFTPKEWREINEAYDQSQSGEVLTDTQLEKIEEWKRRC
jgi:hypothetical protein